MEISKKYFGKTENDDAVYEYTLSNDHFSYIRILNYGGIITEICVPDKHHHIENVVLSLKNIEDYEKKSPYLGCIAGRVAGRISNASFSIDEEKYTLEANNHHANLHGGPLGFDQKLWHVKEISHTDFIGLELSYFSKDKDQGFPGNLNVKVFYKFYNDNLLEITYEATTDKRTLVNLTNHSYFNLSGNYKEDILNHTLTIHAEEYGQIDKNIIPIGITNVNHTPFDFRKGKKIGENIKDHDLQLKYAGGYDHPFLLEKNHPHIILEDEKSGRILEITTDQPCVVLYTSNTIGREMLLRGDVSSYNHLGVCLETQWYPDAINQDFFPTYILNPNEKYISKTLYAFKIRD
ncbi:aldose epimerase family protein [Crassaminicella profunda]|uniref:aldose epimerase family protein n=1 Tax=Crassaminicella profunda TaxID=1286698 RepID=UPI001CA61415|nr:aldose epimerase family protein [Crassaminicella profunda]QZY54452.1 galactose mutarotase [Crassaminicella profunda]